MAVETAVRNDADREKRVVAASSVGAALLLVTMKLTVGVWTGSLGILSEALHSGLDLVAAVVTLGAVSVSGRPADREHTYGHAKVENLAALLEALLLLATCAWIIYEAVERLFFRDVVVEATAWAFAVMVVSIVVDVSRSRALMRVARKHASQALEADAIHFSTDVWSSSVVIAGLFGVLAAQWTGLAWLAKADAAAALGVAGIVVAVSVRLGRRTVSELLDAVPPELRDRVARAARVEGVVEVRSARVRRSGPAAFADVTVAVSRGSDLERAHAVASRAEAAIRGVIPGADVVVHVEPVATDGEDVPTTVQVAAARRGLAAHDVQLFEVDGRRTLELHLEVPDSFTVEAAHDEAESLEADLRRDLPGLDRVVVHLEPAGSAMVGRPVSPEERSEVLDAVAALPGELGIDCQPHAVEVLRVEGRLAVSLHCSVEPGLPITRAHALTEEVERLLHRRIPGLGRVVVHVEPPADGGS